MQARVADRLIEGDGDGGEDDAASASSVGLDTEELRRVGGRGCVPGEWIVGGSAMRDGVCAHKPGVDVTGGDPAQRYGARNAARQGERSGRVRIDGPIGSSLVGPRRLREGKEQEERCRQRRQ
jgi:hypothetical protein